MVYTGYVKPTNKLVAAGKPPIVQEFKIETVANMYPGRLVKKGTNQDDIAVGGIGGAYGWLGHEHTRPDYRPSDVDTIYKVGDFASVLKGGGFAPVASLAAGFSVTKDDKVANWLNGQVMGPVFPAPSRGGLALKIPFTKHASVYDTGIDIPAGMLVMDIFVDVTTNVGSSTIDVGFINAGESGDQDGLLDGLSCAAAGLSYPLEYSTTDGNITLGVLLGTHIKSADSSAIYFMSRKPYVTDGTIKSLVYTTSNDDIAGNIYVVLAYPGFAIVGTAGETVDASSAAADLIVESVI
jgi:hypothetical protein